MRAGSTSTRTREPVGRSAALSAAPRVVQSAARTLRGSGRRRRRRPGRSHVAAGRPRRLHRRPTRRRLRRMAEDRAAASATVRPRESPPDHRSRPPRPPRGRARRSARASIAAEIDEAIRGVVSRGDFVGGEAIRHFEREFAAFCGAPSAVAVGNGTDALELVLEALGVGAGDEVLVPAMTFAATAEAVVRAGAEPVFVDCDPRSMTMSPSAAAAAVGARTRAMIPVHLHGHPADMGALCEIASAHGLALGIPSLSHVFAVSGSHP